MTDRFGYPIPQAMQRQTGYHFAPPKPAPEAPPTVPADPVIDASALAPCQETRGTQQ